MMNNEESEPSDVSESASDNSSSRPESPESTGSRVRWDFDDASTDEETSSKRDSTISQMFIGTYDILRKKIELSEHIVHE
jgi:hypothetical protein